MAMLSYENLIRAHHPAVGRVTSSFLTRGRFIAPAMTCLTCSSLHLWFCSAMVLGRWAAGDPIPPGRRPGFKRGSNRRLACDRRPRHIHGRDDAEFSWPCDSRPCKALPRAAPAGIWGHQARLSHLQATAGIKRIQTTRRPRKNHRHARVRLCARSGCGTNRPSAAFPRRIHDRGPLKNHDLV